MAEVAGGIEVSSDVPFAGTSNIITQDTSDSMAGVRGAAGVIIPAVEDAYRAAQDHNLSGGNSVENVFSNPGSSKPDESELTDLTKISQAFADGHIGRSAAQLKVLALVKQAGVNNPGEASKFRKEAARFFQGAFGGGPNPFGSLSAAETEAAKLRLDIMKKYATASFEAGMGALGIEDSPEGERARAILDERNRFEADTKVIQTTANALRARVDIKKTERESQMFDLQISKYDNIRSFINVTNNGIDLKLNKLIQGGAPSEAEAMEMVSAIQGARLKIESYINDGTVPLDQTKKQELLGMMSHYDRIEKAVNGTNLREITESLTSLREAQAKARLGKRVGWDGLALMNNGKLMEALTLRAQQLDPDAMEALTSMGKLVTGVLKGTTGTVRASNATVDLGALESFVQQVAEGNPNIPEDQLQEATKKLVDAAAGDGTMTTDRVATMKSWEAGNITLQDILRNDVANSRWLYDKLMREGGSIVRRIDKEYIQPLAEGVVELFDSKFEAGDEASGDPGVDPRDYVRLVPHEDGVKAEFIPDRVEELAATSHASLSELIATFNTKLNPRFRMAGDNMYRLETGQFLAHAPFDKHKAVAESLSQKLGLSNPGKTSFDADDDVIAERMKTLNEIASSTLPDAFEKKVATDVKQNDIPIRRTIVKRDKETGKTRSYKVNRSSTADAAERASAYIKGETTEHPFGEIETGPGAITYVFQSKPELFRDKGISQGYLEKLASVESGMNPKIKAKTSSATGLYQFIDSTWDSLVTKYGRRHGVSGDMRTDPVASTLMLGEMINESMPSIKRAIGENRNPEHWELYSYHIFGPGKGRQFVQADPLTTAEEIFPPSWIKANANLLRGKTVGQIRKYFKDKFS